MELVKTISNIISRNISYSGEVKPTDRLQEDLYIDSLDVLMIVHEVEDEFDISVNDDDIRELKTVQDIADYLHLKTANTTLA